MEYLTIQDPRTHHFREMDPYSSDAYAVRSRDAMPRPMRAPSFDHVRTPSPNSHRSPNVQTLATTGNDGRNPMDLLPSLALLVNRRNSPTLHLSMLPMLGQSLSALPRRPTAHRLIRR